MLNLVFSIGIFECLFLILLLVLKKDRKLSDNILIIVLLVSGITITAGYLESYNRRHDFLHPWMINIAAPWVMLLSPILWLYCKSLTQPQFKIKPIYALHLIPYGVILTRHYISTYSRTAAEKIQLMRGQVIIPPYIFYFFLSFAITVVFFYSIWCILIIKNHEKKIMNIFSNTDKINLNWLKLIFFGTLLTYIIAYGLIVLNNVYHFTSFKTTEEFGYGMASIFILILGFYGIKQTPIFTSYNVGLYTIPSDVAKPTVQSHPEKGDVAKITRVMLNDRPYLDADLTLKKLASLTQLSEMELSTIMNNEFHRNFFDYINYHRIEEFKKQLLKPENRHLTILGIALNCGFSSKATFNRVFKAYTQLTPKAYKEKMESETPFSEK